MTATKTANQVSDLKGEQLTETWNHNGEEIKATPAQVESIKRVIERYADSCPNGPDNMFAGFCEQTILLVFPFITIGIEMDGYAHS